MSDNNPKIGDNNVRKVVETAIRIAVLFILLYWCYGIIKPFIDILLWSVIFAVALFPLFTWTQSKMGGRKALSSALIIILMLVVLTIPGIFFAKSLYQGIALMKAQFEGADTIIPLAPEKIASWPVIGHAVYEKWNWISTHLSEALKEYSPQIKQLLLGLVSSAASAGAAFLKLIISIIVSGVILVQAEKARKLAFDICIKLIGEKGDEFAAMAGKTIRTVVSGILGVAFIQSALFGLGMIVAGVPAAGLWAMLALILGIVQIGTLPIAIPLIIYVFATDSTFIAVAFLIWCIIVSPLDNILKPILLGRGAVVPMAVIFIGAIGGFIYSGLVGLFTGAVIFSVGYKLFLFWMEEIKQEREN
jgi:predicted PurR-regulated permease PerM